MNVMHAEISKNAIIDPTGTYRYSLTRMWDQSLIGHLVFVMLNPSTADDKIDDPTIRRCIGFAKTLGYGSMEVVNLFAYRATNPDELKNCVDPIGLKNDEYILDAAKRATQIIFAWGTKGIFLNRGKLVGDLLFEYEPTCLAKTNAGHPKHPLYIKGNCKPISYIGNK
jgi:hypothetical protein